jgi:hypothetical protein
MSSSGSGDLKAQVMNQIREEAAMTNARSLIEVRLLLILCFCCYPSSWTYLISPLAESQPALLREVRTQARLVAFERRDHLLHLVHGEVHGNVEHRQPAVHRADTEGAG